MHNNGIYQPKENMPTRILLMSSIHRTEVDTFIFFENFTQKYCQLYPTPVVSEIEMKVNIDVLDLYVVLWY